MFYRYRHAKPNQTKPVETKRAYVWLNNDFAAVQYG